MAVQKRFPPICIALGLPSVEKLREHARRELENGEQFLEFRLDYLPNPRDGIGVIAELLRSGPECLILATCRRHQNHGHFNGSVDEQFGVLSEAIQAGSRLVDVEIETAEAARQKLESLRTRAAVVISYHNFEGTPQVDPIINRLTKIPADVYKIVTTGRKPSDNWRVLSAGRSHARTPLVQLVMGEVGFPTRVLSLPFNGMYTYASPSGTEGTASGQVCGRQLRRMYQVDKLKRASKIYGVIADPVQHSISPAVHNQAFHTRRVDGVYLPFLVHPQQMKDFFQFAQNLPVAGFSVTIPHKQRVMRYLDAIDPLARRIGAVNTVWKKAGKWRGTNTDALAVTAPLKKLLRLSKSRVLVVGNGGAARGAAFALADAGAKVSIVGRNPDRVRALARACGAEAVSRKDVDSMYFDALVHATPLGMYPKTCECFFPEKAPADVVFEMVYTPRETGLVSKALEQGSEVVYGLQMFLEQAAAQFEIWTGLSAPRAAMERAATEAVQSQLAFLRSAALNKAKEVRNGV